MLAAVVVSVIVLASIGIGREAGWINPSTAPPPAGCGGAALQLWGGLAADPSGPLPGALDSMGSQFASSVTGCTSVSVSFQQSPEPMGLAPLSSLQTDFSVLARLPSPGDLAALPQPAIVVPTALGAVGVVVALPGLVHPINLSAAALAGIYLGTVTKWSDPIIAQNNPGVAWPTDPTIRAFYRSDETGLNSGLSTFLTEANSSWATRVGTAGQGSWPSGTGVDSAAAMLANLSATSGAVGYLEVGTPLPAGLSYVQVENSAGAFVAPTPVAIADGAESAVLTWGNLTALSQGSWTNFSIDNAPDVSSYPMPMFYYLAIYGDVGHAYGSAMSGLEARILSILVWYMVSQGQSAASSEGLAALPTTISQYAEHALTELSYNGAPLLVGSNPEGEAGPENGTGEF
jgi:phosphate transport system substrate-binding protein